MSFGRGVSAFCAVVLVPLAAAFLPANASAPAVPSLPLEQILKSMEHHDRTQAEELKHYQAVRHYQLEYRGLGTSVAAKMEVEVNFDASSGKSFRIVSQSGSKLLCEKVLKKAVDSEEEASKNKEATALTTANYKFQLLGTESLNGRPAYILSVVPLKASKFLYRGKIWVDAEDFAVAGIDAAPAKNPSFWISRTSIRYTSAKTGDFWLPQQSRSETKVLIGGTAVLTIDYGIYQIVSDAPHRGAGD
jgi:hypothetical protein